MPAPIWPKPEDLACATEAEISAIQVSAVQQELTDAALACGQNETDLFNRFQTVFNKELRRSDAADAVHVQAAVWLVARQCRL